MDTDLSQPRSKAPKPQLKIDWCSHEAARYAVAHWYYRSEMPSGKLVKVGVWEDEQFIGAVIFGTGANNHLVRPYGLRGTEGCELVRLALASSHRTPVSRILRIALLFLTRHCPGLRLVVSFADPALHYGGIYQATNWIYTGQTADDFQLVLPNGRVLHSREVSTSGYKRQFGQRRRVPRPQDGTVVTLPGKHRYIYPLDATLRAQLQTFAKPYPKPPRATSIDSDAPAIQVGDGGANPTVALHERTAVSA